MERLGKVETANFNVLSLDGGGSLGVYTLGVLSEMERSLGRRLHEKFDLIFGTSTGSIIASMLALGGDVESIAKCYFDIIPDVMKQRRASGRSRRLHVHGESIFGSRKFDKFLTAVGIVTTDLEHNRPMVFKSHVEQAHGMTASFSAGFGCQISDAVIASSAAFPLFEKKRLVTSAGEKELVDGGFSASNPALLALTDAVGPLGIERSNVRLVSVGTGSYPLKKGLFQRFELISTITTLLGTNANTLDGFRRLVFGDVDTVRIDGSFSTERYRTSFIESNVSLLASIFELGRKSFGKHENELNELLR